jgi:hypothetical protein
MRRGYVDLGHSASLVLVGLLQGVRNPSQLGRHRGIEFRRCGDLCNLPATKRNDVVAC